MPIIEVDNLTKEYRLGMMPGIKQTLINVATRVSGRKVIERPLFKALDNINLAIDSGEVVGIIGHNGAGKSTLLKLLSRISTPSYGSVSVKGKIAPLIEVGAGFLPDFTGRENIYLNGAIVGMSKREIDRKFDDIVAFAEMEDFIDTPVKRYSSGMKVRLAFAVATSVEAEILIVDEVLAVGDLAFQRKCFDRIERMIKTEGNTVLLVSHNIRQVERLCNRALLLDHGRIIADGGTKEVCEMFYRQNNEKIAGNSQQDNNKKRSIRSSGEVEILEIDVLNAEAKPVTEITSGDPLRIRIRFELRADLTRPEFIVGTHTTDFVFLNAASTGIIESRPDYVVGIHEIECIVDPYPMVSGPYCIRFNIFDANRRPVFIGDNLKVFNVTPRAMEWQEGSYRLLNLPTDWVIQGKKYSASRNDTCK